MEQVLSHYFDLKGAKLYMRKFFLCVLLICCLMLNTACSPNAFRHQFFMQSEEDIINPYFVKFIDGVNDRDMESLYALFSASVLDFGDGLTEQISATFTYFPKDLRITEDAHGFYSGTSLADGERRTEINALFTVTANGQDFYAAMKICSEDSSSRDNVGILSIYFISAQNYHAPIHYRGDGKWTPGIHLE